MPRRLCPRAQREQWDVFATKDKMTWNLKTPVLHVYDVFCNYDEMQTPCKHAKPRVETNTKSVFLANVCEL